MSVTVATFKATALPLGQNSVARQPPIGRRGRTPSTTMKRRESIEC
jgi:hypothetical protein